MSYTIVCRSEPQRSEVVPNVVDALVLARVFAQEAEEKVTIMTDSGWVLTLEQLEYLVEK